MFRRFFILNFLALAFISFTSALLAQSEAHKSETIDRNNQMMVVFMERFNSGNMKEARKIASDMAAFSEKYKDTDMLEHKSFSTPIERELYLMKNQGSTKKVQWVEEPVADGYYLLAVLDFNERKYQDALDNMQKCVFWNPVRSSYFSERGFMYLNAGYLSDVVSAQVAYEKAIELASDESSMGAGLRGIGYVMGAKNDLEAAVAAFYLSKEFDSVSPEADEGILYIKRLFPEIDFNMTIAEAKKVLRENNIQLGYSPEHVKVLLKLASEAKLPEEQEKAEIFLSYAKILEPQNAEVEKRLKALRKK